jgi:lipopolysaccharide transport system ATP-binding protein
LSFCVQEGEVLGIIGRNGAGKSTLLKILARITDPSEGQAAILGRVGALLEVGTGFHPELTGRENIFLNGAVLGMKRAEVRQKFDEIVAFAGVEVFLDTPLKRYSSGMFSRLAFAVAAHLEPDILVVDEVLAVGDAEFQRRSLGKMQALSQQGRTTLFVSHDMGAVQTLCSRALLLERGRLLAEGPTEAVIGAYRQLSSGLMSQSLGDRRDRVGDGRLRFTQISIENEDGTPAESALAGAPVAIVLAYEVRPGFDPRNLAISICLNGPWGKSIARLATDLVVPPAPDWQAAGRIRCLIPRLPLHPGRYTMDIYALIGEEVADWLTEVAALNVQAGAFYPTGRLSPHPYWPFLIEHHWEG